MIFQTDRSLGSNVGRGAILNMIGNTPLLPLLGPRNARVRIYGKAEWFNAGGSIKDRTAWSIVRAALDSGEMTYHKTLIDSTSGNTGVAYAMIGATLGFRVALVVPENVSDERKKIIKAYGAEIIYSDPYEGSDGAIVECRRLVAAHPDRYYYADQYSNEANWRAHYESTGPEIWQQTAGRITHFVACLGTTGTIIGTGRYLKERNPNVKIIGVQPDDPMHGIEGLKHLPTAIVPRIYDESVLDAMRYVNTETAFAMARRIAAEEGMFIGQSGGAAAAACRELAEELGDDAEAVIVTVFPDGGGRYLSTRLWR